MQIGESLLISACPLLWWGKTPEHLRMFYIGTPENTCAAEQQRALVLLLQSALHSEVRWGPGLCPVHSAVRGPWCGGLCARHCVPGGQQGRSVHGTLSPHCCLHSPPPLLLNLFKLGERGEEVRPFGEAT